MNPGGRRLSPNLCLVPKDGGFVRGYGVRLCRDLSLYAATKVDMPMNHSRAAEILHRRLTRESVRSIAIRKPKAILETPIVRTKRTLGLFPLQIDQRMKFGCDWPRRAASAILTAGSRAEGWVVCWRHENRGHDLCVKD
jgi:hypothetical protein